MNSVKTSRGTTLEKPSFNRLLKKAASRSYVKEREEIIKEASYVLIGDVLTWLRKLPSRSVNVVVTSPPYWNQRDYGVCGQIGAEKNPALYIDKLIAVGEELKRVLKDDGAYFLNIGDTYVDKSLQLIPDRVAMGMQERGWLIRNKIIWHKPNHMPSPVKCRFKNTYEQIFYFTKNSWEQQVYFCLDEVRVPYKTEGTNRESSEYHGKFNGERKNIGASPGGRMAVSHGKVTEIRSIKVTKEVLVAYLERHMYKKAMTKGVLIKLLGPSYKHKVGHWFRLDGGFSYPSQGDWLKLKKILEFSSEYDHEMTTVYKKEQGIYHHPLGKNPGDLWEINTEKTRYKHFAIFPEKIPYMAIKSCAPKNGVVLDPFAGTGTTGKVAGELGRRFILIDINNKYLNIMKDKIGTRFKVLRS